MALSLVLEGRGAFHLVHGRSEHALREVPDASIDALVTDPPAGISFMGEEWDAPDTGAEPEEVGALPDRAVFVAALLPVLREALRVLKPGAHGFVWALPRTAHWTGWALEEAGFEVRDSVMHVFGQGFPKSLDVAKAIDKRRDDREEVLVVTRFLRSERERSGKTNAQIDALFGLNGMAGHWTTQESQPEVPNPEQWVKIRELLGFENPEMDALAARLNERKGERGEAWKARPVEGQYDTASAGQKWAASYAGEPEPEAKERRSSEPTREEAKPWRGWGTALKPAHEVWLLVRRPLAARTLLDNVLAHGSGAIHVDACRTPELGGGAGRWPSNLALSHLPECEEGGDCPEGCAVAALDAQTESVSRFFPVFYAPKAARVDKERGARTLGRRSLSDALKKKRANMHPTVKPGSLMRWLVRLITPAGGIVLDPFAGSGSTGVAAMEEGCRFLGVEQAAEHATVARRRVADAAVRAQEGR